MGQNEFNVLTPPPPPSTLSLPHVLAVRSPMARVTSSPLTASYERTQNMCRSVVMKSMFLDSKDGLKSSKVAMRPRI